MGGRQSSPSPPNEAVIDPKPAQPRLEYGSNMFKHISNGLAMFGIGIEYIKSWSDWEYLRVVARRA